MKILYRSREKYTMKELYDLTKSPNIDKMSNHVDEVIDLQDYLVYDKEDAGAEQPVKVASVVTPEGEIMATNSKTFIEAFTDMLDMAVDAGEQVHSIKVISGKSRNGRTYITCEYLS